MATPTVTEHEFERAYAERSGVTVEQLRNEWGRIVLPCDPELCEYEGCKGWISVSWESAYHDAKVYMEASIRAGEQKL